MITIIQGLGGLPIYDMKGFAHFDMSFTCTIVTSSLRPPRHLLGGFRASMSD